MYFLKHLPRERAKLQKLSRCKCVNTAQQVPKRGLGSCVLSKNQQTALKLFVSSQGFPKGYDDETGAGACSKDCRLLAEFVLCLEHSDSIGIFLT